MTSRDEIHQTTEQQIRLLAAQYDLNYEEAPLEKLALYAARVIANAPALDDVVRMLVALERQGHIAGQEAARLHARYLKEKGFT